MTVAVKSRNERCAVSSDRLKAESAVIIIAAECEIFSIEYNVVCQYEINALAVIICNRVKLRGI